MADIVIVGAGVTGLYTAYSLISQWFCEVNAAADNWVSSDATVHPDQTRNVRAPPVIVIIDKKKNVGGRIDSLPLLGAQPSPPFEADLCAMRYYPQLMPVLDGLVKSLICAGNSNLGTSVIPAPDIPLVTPTYPGIEADLVSAYPEVNTRVNQAIEFAAAVTLATGDYNNVGLLTGSTGYRYMEENVNLFTSYEEYPVSGLSEVRFAHGFNQLTFALLAQIRAMYMQACDFMKLHKIALGEGASIVSKEAFCQKCFKLYLCSDVCDVSEVCPPGCFKRLSAATVNNSNEGGWFSWMTGGIWSSSNASSSSSNRPDMAATQPHGDVNRLQPSGAVYRVHFKTGECSDMYWYDCNQVIFTSTMSQMSGTRLGTYCFGNGKAWDYDESRLKKCWVGQEGSGLISIPQSAALPNTATATGARVASIARMQERVNAARGHVSFHPGVKVYIHFKQPWWDPSKFYKFCLDPLINQVQYFSPNVLLVYVIATHQADTLLSMFEQDFPLVSREQLTLNYMDKWISSASASTILNYIKSRLPTIIASAVSGPLPQPQPTQAQLDSSDMLIFHYVDQALGTPMPFSGASLEYDALFQFILSGRNRRDNPSAGLWWLSGDLSIHGGGWVETGLATVNSCVGDIYDMIEWNSSNNRR